MTVGIKLWTSSRESQLRETTLKVIPPAMIVGRHEVTNKMPSFGKCVVLALGTAALRTLADHGVVPKNRTISSLRESVFNVNGAQLLLSYSPDAIDGDISLKPQIMWDAQLAYRLANTGALIPEVGEYTYVDNFDAIEAQLDAAEKPIPLVADLETLGLDPYAETAWIVSIQLCLHVGSGEVIRYSGPDDPRYPANNAKARDQILRILGHPMARVRGANFKFDLMWLWVHWSVDCPRFTMDTTLVGSLLDENRSNSLEAHAKSYTAMGGYDTGVNSMYNKGRMDLIPDAPFLTYSAGDVDACMRVSKRLTSALADQPRLKRFYTKLLHPSMLAFHDMERVGVCVDVPYMETLKLGLDEKLSEITEQAYELLPRRLQARHGQNFSLTRSAITADFLFSKTGLELDPIILTKKTQAPSTAMEHLSMFVDHEDAGPWVRMLQEHTKISKVVSTYITGFLSHLRTDGRFHPTAMLYRGAFQNSLKSVDAGTVTGRTSFRDPAIQCMTGDTIVTLSNGSNSLLEIGSRVNAGETVLVKTHTGAMRRVLHFVDNGPRYVLIIRLSSGTEIRCTPNHRVLTTTGWVFAQDLVGGENVFRQFPGSDGTRVRDTDSIIKVRDGESGALDDTLRVREDATSTSGQPEERQHEELWLPAEDGADSRTSGQRELIETSEPNVSVMGEHEDALPESEQSGVPELRRQGHQGVPTVDDFQQFPGGHGTDARRALGGAGGRERGLYTRELCVADSQSAVAEPKTHAALHVPRAHRDADGSVRVDWAQALDSPYSTETWLELGEGHGDIDALAAYGAGYGLDIVLDTRLGTIEPTYDLTVDQCHSYVANGIVVHNTVPKHGDLAKLLRKAYVAPPGYQIACFDYSQGELRVAACIANERDMIQAYLKGMDLHALTGGRIIGLKYETVMDLKVRGDAGDKGAASRFEVIRQNGKSANFGLLYGMGGRGYEAYAWQVYQVRLKEGEGDIQKAAFFESYPSLLAWHTRYKGQAHKLGLVQSPLGRVRHLPMISSRDREVVAKAERQAINSPVQSTLSDLALLGLADFRRKYGCPDECQPFMMIHDMLGWYVKEDAIDVWVPRLRACLEEQDLPGRFGWAHQLPFPTDWELGPNLGQMAKQKG